MKLLANENFPLTSVLYLRSKGFDITSVGTDNPSVQDKAVMNIAISDEYEADEPGRLIEELINKKEFELDNALTVLDKNGIRQRKY